MSPRTHQFTRDQLLDVARKVHSGHVSIANICTHREDLGASTAFERDAVEAIVHVLESYPLANAAAEAVRVVCDDLAERGGFREVIEQIGSAEWTKLRELLTAKLANTVVYAEPTSAAPTRAEAIEMDFAT